MRPKSPSSNRAGAAGIRCACSKCTSVRAAYSNREFYDERLLVYPSPVREDPEFGVSCQKIDGAYEFGQGRNLKKVYVIVDEAASPMRARTDHSIGIVAMNQAQRNLIET